MTESTSSPLPETVFRLLRIIHRPHCQMFSLELLSTQVVPIKQLTLRSTDDFT